jgi:hypothetical protein
MHYLPPPAPALLWCLFCFTGAAFVAGQLITVGVDGNICVWGLNTPAAPLLTSPTPAAQQHQYEPAAMSTHKAGVTRRAAGQGNSTASHMSEQQQQQQQQYRALDQSSCAASLRTWLEPRRAAGAAAGSAGGVPVEQQQPMLVDEGRCAGVSMPLLLRAQLLYKHSVAT